MSTETAYIALGSNMGNREANCIEAARCLDGIPGCRVAAQSCLYRTEPVGVEGQDWYVNGVLSLETSITAGDLLEKLLGIETGMGRERKGRWDPRPIDLDIVLFGALVIEEKGLKVPHPRMHERRFVLAPLVELAPDMEHPVLGVTMRVLLEGLDEEGQHITRIASRDMGGL